jgi:DNA mismatch repair protein MutL
VEVLGPELDAALLETEHHDPPQQGGSSLWLMLGRPEIARATTRFQYFTVNGRPIRDRQLAHAVKEAYRGLIPPDRHPVVVLNLRLDPSAVDVNVHPTKAEVRFREPSRIHGLVLNTCRRCLLAHDLTPRVQWRIGDGESSPEEAATPALASDTQDGTHRNEPSATRHPPPAPSHADPSAFVDYFKRMDPKQKGFIYDEVRREMNEPPEETATAEAASRTDPSAIPSPPAAFKPLPILQVHDSFVVTQDEQGMLIIDQHALHERMMFESLRTRILQQGRPLESQRLLVPVTLPADADRQALLAPVAPLLHALGIEAAPLGPRSLAIHAFPSLLIDRKVEPAAFVSDLLDKADAGAFDLSAAFGEDDTEDQAEDARLRIVDLGQLEAALHEVLDTMSCKAAVKAGDRLSEGELAELLSRRDVLERASNCPHGRPTTLRLSLAELYRQFGRT